MKCIRCGKCCEVFNPYRKDKQGPCLHLGYKDKKAFCDIYETRPKTCVCGPGICKEAKK